MVNPRELAGNPEEEEWQSLEIQLGTWKKKKKKNGEPHRYC